VAAVSCYTLRGRCVCVFGVKCCDLCGSEDAVAQGADWHSGATEKWERKNTMPNFDLTFVSGARPELMEKTLKSFSKFVFSNLTFENAYFNIDPIFGGEVEVKECTRIARSFLNNAIIYTPRQPSFGAAVKRLWLSTSENHVLHLEDDWEIDYAVGENTVKDRFVDDVGMLQLAIESREKYGGDFLFITKRKRILGFEIYSRKVNAYGTSPRFFRGGLCQKFGALLRENLDPEKQVYKNKNSRLSRAHMPWKCAVLYGDNGAPLIRDLGRDWRSARNISKVDKNGRASWVIKNEN
jgi:hypothetical protein